MLKALILKELHTQTRTRLYHIVNILYIILISCLMFGMIWIYASSKKTEPQYALKIFSASFIILNLSVSMICPAFAINSISSEKEKSTINLLRTTQLKYYIVFLGKLFSGILHVLTLLFASVPIVILIVSETDMSIIKISLCYLIIFISSVMFITISLMCSSILKTRMSAVSTYIVIIIFNFCTLIIPSIITRIYKLNVSNKLITMIKALNPFYIIVNIINDKLILTSFIKLPAWVIISVIYLLISVLIIIMFLLIGKLFQRDVIF